MRESLAEALVLHPDVRVTPVSALDPSVRDQLAEDAHSVQSRVRSRATSRTLDAAGAELLNAFGTPTTVADAIVDFALRHALDPRQVLMEAYPLLRQCRREGVLVAPGESGANALAPTLSRGGAFDVLHCVQSLEDVEVYCTGSDGGGTAALKIARPGVDRNAAFDRERAMLAHADGCCVPRLIEAGTWEGRDFLRLEWIEGRDPLHWAKEASLPARVTLGVAILRACAALHDRDIVHGDIHAGNVLVDADGMATILDFGLARVVSAHAGTVPRGGNALYFEPEYAQAKLAGAPPPAATFRSEQYALAVLVYRLLFDKFPIALSIDQQRAWEEIATTPPIGVGLGGVDFRRDADAIFARALNKDPAERFDDLHAFACALEGLATCAGESALTDAAVTGDDESRAFIDSILKRYDWDSPLLEGPWPRDATASVAFGAAGIALMHLRVALRREDPRLLALADAWACRAVRESHTPTAFESADLDLTQRTVGLASPLHAHGGPHTVAAYVAIARRDRNALRVAIEAFIASTHQPAQGLDATVGIASVLLGCANLREQLVRNALPVPTTLDGRGGELRRSLWRALRDALPGDSKGPSYFGIAHGWAGILYATLRWDTAQDQCSLAGVREACDALAGYAQPWGLNALRWPRGAGSAERSAFWTGWCHGSAGYVHLWLAAWRAFGDEDYKALARGAARHAASDPHAVGQLCCGTTGQAYALLDMHRSEPSAEWRDAARDLANRAIAASGSAKLTAHSLYKGEIGTAILAAELDDPSGAHFPFFTA
ncbi:hypothetical protein LYSHEL_15990 [Lysobacter helvus]|uniref:Protein kinase domain-containing protein n=2 Tax=Lysobacteraceae TaxID=32033 RepID=A0ABN6FT76_9GAMM|nr:hypothetical protein LYSCAS_15990 [Lysobacter caseinilyticus]BCT95728.1 hypothetical protein LYSHEL_15990 [Lysobacter helvus]